MNKNSIVNIILSIITVIAIIILIVLYSSIMSGAATVATGTAIYDSAVSTISNANLDVAEVEANNIKYESYFGTKKSAVEVKQLISMVTSDNSLSSTSVNPSKIAIKLDGNIITDSSSITSGKTYSVNVANDKASDQDPTQNNSSDAAYYNSGFLRIITISENK